VLNSDDTIADVWSKLAHPHEYLEGVLENLLVCKREHGSAVVRIGVTGSGQKPYYWIMCLGPSGNRVSHAAFFDNHGPFAAEEKPVTEGKNWSSEHMTLKEIAALYGEVA
jgi:hypothetical protein